MSDMDKQKFLAELRRLKQYYFDSCQPLSGTLMTICGQFIRRIEDGEFDPAQADGGLAGGLLDSLKRIADMKDRDGNSIEMTAQELQGIARRAIACHENAGPSHSGWQPMETAPRDGTHVILRTGMAVGEARFITDTEQWWWANMDPTDAYDGSVLNPLGWQPMPALPSPEVKP